MTMSLTVTSNIIYKVTSKYSSVPVALMSSIIGIRISFVVSPDLKDRMPSFVPTKSFPAKADWSIVLYLTCTSRIRIQIRL